MDAAHISVMDAAHHLSHGRRTPSQAISIFCAMLGFLSPANRGSLLTATILVFMLMGVPAGYISSNTYKSLKGAALRWSRSVVCVGVLRTNVEGNLA